uniref:Aminotransferase n=2 Tax=Chloropicon TaxID=2302914 RepID=A0A7S3E3S8_9CHLO|mmetsp:Transcript_2069/g.4842  ORF Transcript_2069/g.4842 Transcript_2069/m.4842 type:complete len:493 (-) Transcript_2069:202-1680(-)|eukprot:CAMPEP_0197487828 /NCGR_PEP_ID=MMETSP1311-20131121/2842_1 /TAXON_ID=464262 /ORGANISM="Genus nov. species nov., Strain RCC856" /LENGTH=492 /DNA_ID=CAMNT_0043031657 /DNA_START=87 /DNA_END=1565 /DNA_ORIENTATION=-
MARLCGTKLSKDSRKLRESSFGFTFSGPKKYTRLSPSFVARVPSDGIESKTAEPASLNAETLTRDPKPVFDVNSAEPRLAVPIKSPMPVPEEGIQRCREVMESGKMFRYGGLTKGANNEDQTVDDVSLVERSFADVTGHKYCVALNSCGSAIFLSVFAVLQKEKERLSKIPGPTKILTNAFTFAAVPSAIVHAGCEPEYVNCTEQFVINVEDFEKKAIESGAKIAIVSHMRGRIADMAGIAEVCKKYDITLIEDCAHSLGCDWKGVKSGSSEYGTVAACFSSQSNKLINSGEGGFLVTDDEEIAIRCILAAGSYEVLYKSHLAAPDGPENHAMFDKLKFETPNFSLRMHQITAAIIQPQLPLLEERFKKHRYNYAIAERRLCELEGISLPGQMDGATQVGDSLQFNLVGRDRAGADAFCKETAKRGVPMEIFGALDNARNFKTWQFALPPQDCETSYKHIEYACDLRLPLHLTEADIHSICDVIEFAIQVTA